MNPQTSSLFRPTETADAEYPPGELERAVERGYRAFIERRGLQYDPDFRYGANSFNAAPRRGRRKRQHQNDI
jgi:hypothetical protein